MNYKRKFYVGFNPLVIRIGSLVFYITADPDVAARIDNGRWYLGERES